MSAVVNAVVNVFTAVVDFVVDIVETVWDAIVDVATFIWDEVIYPILTFVMGLFGIEDEDVISTEVSTQKIFDTDDANQMFVTMALAGLKDEGSSPIDNLILESMKVKEKYQGAFNYAEQKYSKGLPTTNINGNTVSEAAVKEAIDTEYGVDCTVMDAKNGVVGKWEWVAYQLRVDYSYIASSKTLMYNSPVYLDGATQWSAQNVDYNYSTGWYDVSIARSLDVNTDVTVATNADDDTLDDVTTRVVKYTSLEGTLVSDTTTVVTVDAGTVAESNTDSTDNETSTISVVDYTLDIHTVARYYTTDPSIWYYWAYTVGSGVYPEIDDGSSVSYQMASFMPTVVLRNNGVDTVANKDSIAYKEAKDLLRIIGVDIDDMTDNINDNPDIGSVMDVMINYTINLKDSTPEINKLLYNTFEDLYLNTNLYANTSGGSAFTATVQESPYNLALMWKSQTRSIISGVLGDVGTVRKRIVGDDLILEYQETVDEYVRYTIAQMSAVTFIDRAGMYGTVIKTLSQGIEMPIPFFALNTLTPIEQTRLFPYTVKIHFYAANITHLEWYETAAFASFIKIIAVVIAVVVAVASVGTASSVSAAIISAASNLAIGLAVGYALKMIMTSNIAPWLKGVLAVAVLVVGYGDISSINVSSFISPEALLTSVSEITLGQTAAAIGFAGKAYSMHVDNEMHKLDDKRSTYEQLADQRMKGIEAAKDELTFGLDVTQVVALNDLSIDGYVDSIDYFYYAAKGNIQYSFDLLYVNPNENFYGNKLLKGIV